MLPRRPPRRQTIAYSALYSDPDALAEMFELLDAGRTGEISFPELQRVVDILNGDASEDDDNDDDEDEDGDEGEGSEGGGDDKVGVDVDPLYGVAFRHQPVLDARAIWSLLDINKDGAISMNEFAEWNRAAGRRLQK